MSKPPGAPMSLLFVLAVAACGRESTQAPAPSIQARVDVAPSSFSLEVGETRQLEASVTDIYGSALDESLTWASTRSSVASVSQSGQVTGAGLGDAEILAVAGGASGTSSVTVVSSDAGDGDGGSGDDGSGDDGSGGGVPWSGAFGPGANQPGGLWAFFDTDGTTKDLGSQWIYGKRWGDRFDATEPVQRDINHVTVVDDPGTPSGQALRILYPNCAGSVCAGFSGAAFWNNWRGFVPDGADYPDWAGQALDDVSELYIRKLIKLESGWQFHTATDKLTYWGGCGASSPGTSADFFLNISGDSQLRWRNQGGAGRDKAPFSAIPNLGGGWAGQWVEIEIYMKAQSSPGASDGSLRVWIDGQEIDSWQGLGQNQTNRTTLKGNAQWYNSTDNCLGFFGIQWGLFWGGQPQERTQDQYMRWGGLYLSGRP